MEVPFHLFHFPSQLHYQLHLFLQHHVQIVEVILDIRTYFISLVPQNHLLLGHLNRTIYTRLMLFYQFLLLLQNQFDVVVVFLAEVVDILGLLELDRRAFAYKIVDGFGVVVEVADVGFNC